MDLEMSGNQAEWSSNGSAIPGTDRA